MINSRNRFHGHGSLRYVNKNGSKSRSHLFVVKALRNPRRDQSRFAVVVSKKSLKSAVGRNRIRRRVYEVLRLEINKISQPYDIVVIVVSADARNIAQNELEGSLKDLLEQTGVYGIPQKSGIISSVKLTETVEKTD